jgi:hypothetical protein
MIYITVGDIPERQCCGSGLDPGSIRSVDPGQKWPTKKFNNACFEELDVLFCGLKTCFSSPVAGTSLM